MCVHSDTDTHTQTDFLTYTLMYRVRERRGGGEEGRGGERRGEEGRGKRETHKGI